MEPGPLGGIGGDLERLLEEGDRLLVRAERRRSLGGAAKRDAGLRGERVGLRRIRGQPLRREVVAGQPAGELVRAEALEEARRGEVADLAVLLRERVVGDLADQAPARSAYWPRSGERGSTSRTSSSRRTSARRRGSSSACGGAGDGREARRG